MPRITFRTHHAEKLSRLKQARRTLEELEETLDNDLVDFSISDFDDVLESIDATIAEILVEADIESVDP